MTYILEYLLENGSIVRLDVNSVDASDGVRGRRVGFLTRAEETFEAALDSLRPAVEAITRKLTNFQNVPDEIGVEFGVRLSAEAGAIIASTSADAHITVKLGWKRNTRTVPETISGPRGQPMELRGGGDA
jgi:hypothetical protein